MHIKSWVSCSLVPSYSFVVRVLERAAVGEVGANPGCAERVALFRPYVWRYGCFVEAVVSARSLLASSSNCSTNERFSSSMPSFSIAP